MDSSVLKEFENFKLRIWTLTLDGGTNCLLEKIFSALYMVLGVKAYLMLAFVWWLYGDIHYGSVSYIFFFY